MRKKEKIRLAGSVWLIAAFLLFLTGSSFAYSVCQPNLPTNSVTMTVDVNEYKACNVLPLLDPPAYLYATFSNAPAGYSVANGTYAGYCSDLSGTILDNPLFGNIIYQAKFWSSLDPNLPTSLIHLNFTDQNNQVILYTIPWDKINYVINKFPAESWLNLQPAIWSLVHGCNPQTSATLFDCSPVRSAPYYFPFGSTYANVPYGCPNSNPPIVDIDRVNMIVSDANANGAGFVPAPGDKIAIVIQPTDCVPLSICNQYLPFQILFLPVTCPNACIDIKKQISVDEGATWFDADTAGDAPSVNAPHGAMYKLVVTNCGDVDLTDVFINDSTLGITDHSVGNLAAGASLTLTSADISQLQVSTVCNAEGSFENIATISGKAYGNPITESNPAWLVCTKPETHPCIDVTKTCSDASGEGGSISFSGVVTNCGDVDLDNVTVVDDKTGTVLTMSPLKIGQSSNYSGSYVPDSSPSTDTVTATGKDSINGGTVSKQASATCQIRTRPSVSITKTCSGICKTSRSSVKKSCTSGCFYTFTAVVKNTGNETLGNITCKDNPDVPLSGVKTSLAPGESFTVTGNTTSSTDTLTCSANGAVTGTSVSNSGSASCNTVKPAIKIEKYVSADGRNWSQADYAPGIMVSLCSTCRTYERKSDHDDKTHTECYNGSSDNCGKVYYKFVATNTGTTQLTNISLSDSLYPLSNCVVPANLNPMGGSFTCTIGPFPAQEGQNKNTATAAGYYNGIRYEDSDNAFYYGKKTSCR